MSYTLILANAASPHTRALVDGLRELGKRVEIISLDKNSGPEVVQVYSSDVKLHDFFQDKSSKSFLAAMRFLTERVNQSSPERIISLGMGNYSQLSAGVGNIGCPKIAVALGTDIIVQQTDGRRADLLNGAFDRIIVPSHYLAEKVSLLSRTPVLIAPFGLSINDLHDQDEGKADGCINDRDKYFLMPKYYKEIYGHKVVIDAIALVKNHFLRSGFKFVFCGAGSEKREGFEGYANLKGVSEICVFHDFLDSDRVLNLMKRSRATVVASAYESFGQVIIESFACGTPVIGPKIPGFRDASGNFAFMDSFERNSATSLAERLRSAMATEISPEESRRLISFSQNFNRRRFLDVLTQDLSQLDTFNRRENGVVFFHNLEKASLLNYGVSTRARNVRVSNMLTSFEFLRPTIDLSVRSQEVLKRDISHLNLRPGDIVYLEMGSLVSSQHIDFLERVFVSVEKMSVRVVFYYSDCHPLDYLYSLQCFPKIVAPVQLRRSFRKLNTLLKKYAHVQIAVPSNSFLKFAGLSSEFERSMELPPAVTGNPFAEGAATEFPADILRKVRLNYAGGLGFYYQMQRALFAIGRAKIPLRIFTRKRDYNNVGFITRMLLARNPVEVVFDEEFSVSDRASHLDVGLVLSEPLPYLQTAMNVKLFTYLEMGMPILAYEGTAVGDFIEKWNVGWVVKAKAAELYSFLESERIAMEHAQKVANIGFLVSQNVWEQRVKAVLGGRDESV